MTDQQPTPEPLSAERQLSLLRVAARADPILRQAVADVESYLDALRTENAELRREVTALAAERRLQDPNVLAVARRLIRGNVIEDVDHRELYEAVRQVTA